MKIGIVGASNVLISVEKGLGGENRTCFETNLISVVKEMCSHEIEVFGGFTIAKINDLDECYIDCVKKLTCGDVLFVQGEGNDCGKYVPRGDMSSENEREYYGALNIIAKLAKEKFKRVIFATGFNVTKSEEYKKYNSAIKAVAEKNGFEVIDFYSDARFVAGDTLPDNEHMNEKGLKIYAKEVLKLIDQSDVHEMKLNNEPFEAITKGKKRIELRLWDEKRRAVKNGDFIVFTNNVTKETVTARVLKLHRGESFEMLFEKISDPESMGFENGLSTKEMAECMRRYYSCEEEEKYGVVGIEIYV